MLTLYTYQKTLNTVAAIFSSHFLQITPNQTMLRIWLIKFLKIKVKIKATTYDLIVPVPPEVQLLCLWTRPSPLNEKHTMLNHVHFN